MSPAYQADRSRTPADSRNAQSELKQQPIKIATATAPLKYAWLSLRRALIIRLPNMQNKEGLTQSRRPSQQKPLTFLVEAACRHRSTMRSQRSHFERLQLLKRCQSGLHELGLLAISLQSGDQTTDLGMSLPQRCLDRFGLLQDGVEAAAIVMVVVVVCRRRD